MARTINEEITPEEAIKVLYVLREEVKIIKNDIRELRAISKCIDGDRFMSTKEVCYYLNISDRQIRRYVKSEELKATYFGRKVSYRQSEVIRFLNEVLLVKGRYRNNK